jgi:nucleotide-binding universal stress UspA family protein
LRDPVGATESELRRFLNYHCGDILPFVETRTSVELGTPETNIVDRARASRADLIVLTTHGRTGLAHVLLGSVAERVVRHAECPVVTVRPARFQKSATGAAT